MNRVQLIDAIAAQTNLSKKDVSAVVESLLTNIKDSVQRGDTVQLVGFGSFKQLSKPARKCRNPLTGETIKVPAKKVAKFSVGKAFAEQVNTKPKAKAPAKKSTAKTPAKKAPVAKKTVTKKPAAKKTKKK